MRKALSALAVLAIALVALMIPIAGATTTYTTTIQVVGPTNSALSSATVKIFATNGTMITSGTTNSTGYVTLSLANGTYVALVTGPHYYIFELFKVAGTTKVVINATKLHYVNVTSLPATTSFTAKLDGLVPVTFNTNVTIYGDKNATLTFPSSFVSFPYMYKFANVKNATGTYNTSTIFVNMTSANQVVTATYTQSIAFTSPLFMIIVALLLIAVVAGAYFASAHAIFNATFRFVRRTGESQGKRYVRAVDSPERKHYVRKDED